jgi:hypothetical protein
MKPIAIWAFLCAILVGGIVVRALRTGRVLNMQVYDRQENPMWFWFCTLLYGAVACFFLYGAISQYLPAN